VSITTETTLLWNTSVIAKHDNSYIHDNIQKTSLNQGIYSVI